MSINKSIIKSGVVNDIKKALGKAASDIGEELKDAYEASLQEWWEPFVKWSKNKHSESSFSFLRAASSEYGKGVFTPEFVNDAWETNLIVSPDKMNAGLVQQWGEKREFSDEEAFDMMYVKGVYGFNKEIISKTWYKTKESIDGYIARTNAPKDITRDEIISKLLKQRKFAPPIKRRSPDKIMQRNAKKILNKQHIEDIVFKYLKGADLVKTRR